MFHILGWIFFGLIVGVIAKFLLPGRDPSGFLVTIGLGIAGAFVGGFLARLMDGMDHRKMPAISWRFSARLSCSGSTGDSCSRTNGPSPAVTQAKGPRCPCRSSFS